MWSFWRGGWWRGGDNEGVAVSVVQPATGAPFRPCSLSTGWSTLCPRDPPGGTSGALPPPLPSLPTPEGRGPGRGLSGPPRQGLPERHAAAGPTREAPPGLVALTALYRFTTRGRPAASFLPAGPRPTGAGGRDSLESRIRGTGALVVARALAPVRSGGPCRGARRGRLQPGVRGRRMLPGVGQRSSLRCFLPAPSLRRGRSPCQNAWSTRHQLPLQGQQRPGALPPQPRPMLKVRLRHARSLARSEATPWKRRRSPGAARRSLGELVERLHARPSS